MAVVVDKQDAPYMLIRMLISCFFIKEVPHCSPPQNPARTPCLTELNVDFSISCLKLLPCSPNQLSFYFFIHSFIYLFWAVLGHCCCVGFSLVGGEQRLLSLQGVSFPLHWLLLLQSTGSRASGLQQLLFLGSRAQAQ